MWDLATGTPVVAYQKLLPPVQSFAFSADGTRIAIGCGDGKSGEVRILEFGPKTTDLPKELFLRNETGGVSFVTFCADDSRCVWASKDGFRSRGADGTITSCAINWLQPIVVSPGGRYLAMQENELRADYSYPILVIDTATLTKKWKIPVKTARLTNYVFSPSENVLAIKMGERLVPFDVTSGKSLPGIDIDKDLAPKFKGYPHLMAFNPRTGDLAVNTTGNYDGVRVFSIPGARRETPKP